MAAIGFTVFDTAIGPCGVAWGERGLVGLQLPGGEGDVAATLGRLARRHPQAVEGDPPPAVAAAIARMIALLDGQADDLRDIDIAATPAFERAVYDAARAISPGETATYGEIAARIGEPGAARAVGAALGANPWPIVVPCHRVLGAGGKVGGFSAPGGVQSKMRMLTIEKARTNDAPSLFEHLPLAAGPKR